MEFDRSRVYSAVNADELKPGDKVIVADSIGHLKRKVENCKGVKDPDIIELWKIGGEDSFCRFRDKDFSYENDEHCSALAYLVERAEPKTEHDCQSCKYKNCGFKDFNTKNECDRWETEQKAETPELISLGNGQYVEKSKTEKKYRPFETIGELINEWVIKGGEWQHREKIMPLIWVRGKNCSVNRLITSFDETEKGDRVMICGLDCSMEDLFNIYTFLDGSPCGVEE